MAMQGGCSYGPGAIKPVAVDPGSASTKAVELYDKSGDGLLDTDELAEIPGILKNLEKYDANHDGLVSKSEIEDRIAIWKQHGLGMCSLNVVVLLEGKPLESANVTFVPEPYLGEGPKIASGVTDRHGTTKVSIDTSTLPESLQELRVKGIYGGTYKIEVTHPSKEIPKVYNAETTLGAEVAKDTTTEEIKLNLKTQG